MIIITEMRCPEKRRGHYPQCENACRSFKEQGEKACEKIFAEEEWNGRNPCGVCGQHARLYININGTEQLNRVSVTKNFGTNINLYKSKKRMVNIYDNRIRTN